MHWVINRYDIQSQHNASKILFCAQALSNLGGHVKASHILGNLFSLTTGNDGIFLKKEAWIKHASVYTSFSQ